MSEFIEQEIEEGSPMSLTQRIFSEVQYYYSLTSSEMISWDDLRSTAIETVDRMSLLGNISHEDLLQDLETLYSKNSPHRSIFDKSKGILSHIKSISMANQTRVVHPFENDDAHLINSYNILAAGVQERACDMIAFCKNKEEGNRYIGYKDPDSTDEEFIGSSYLSVKDGDLVVETIKQMYQRAELEVNLGDINARVLRSVYDPAQESFDNLNMLVEFINTECLRHGVELNDNATIMEKCIILTAKNNPNFLDSSEVAQFYSKPIDIFYSADLYGRKVNINNLELTLNEHVSAFSHAMTLYLGSFALLSPDAQLTLAENLLPYMVILFTMCASSCYSLYRTGQMRSFMQNDLKERFKIHDEMLLHEIAHVLLNNVKRGQLGSLRVINIKELADLLEA
jgi:hypothetical protein